jgi:hypothetical protein
MKLDEELGLTAIFGAEASTAENKHHGVLSLQVGEFAAGCSVIT